MIWRLSIWLFISLAVFQTGLAQNPFEIKPRLESMGIPDQELDSIASGIDLIERSIRPIPGETDFSPIKIESQNPFEVSHIPLRKNKQLRQLTKEELSEEKSAFYNRNIPFFLIILSILIIAVVIGFKDNVITKALKANYNANYLKLIMSDAFSVSIRTYFLLYTLFFINLALALSHLLKPAIYQNGLWYIFLIILIVYFVRHISLWLLGYVFSEVAVQAKEYNFSIQIGNIALGLVLLPLNIIMIYGFPSGITFFTIILLIILLFAYLLRAFRSTKMITGFLFSNRIHFFLYLCACEIGPILILFKFIVGIN